MPTPNDIARWRRKQKAGKSLRAIATEDGVSHSIVSRSLRKPRPKYAPRMVDIGEMATIHARHGTALRILTGRITPEELDAISTALKPLLHIDTMTTCTTATAIQREVKIQLLKALGFD